MANFGEGDSPRKVSTQEGGALPQKETAGSADGVRQSVPVDDVVKCHAAELVGTLLREELRRSASNTIKRDVSRKGSGVSFPFNRHTVTVGMEGEYVDFAQMVRDLPKTQKTQIWVAKEIEKVKRGQVKKYTQSELTLKEDIKHHRYVYDLNKTDILAKGFGDVVVNNFSCTCGSPEAAENSEDTVCYNCYSNDDNDIISSPYVFNSTITPYPIVYSAPMADVDI